MAVIPDEAALTHELTPIIFAINHYIATSDHIGLAMVAVNRIKARVTICIPVGANEQGKRAFYRTGSAPMSKVNDTPRSACKNKIARGK